MSRGADIRAALRATKIRYMREGLKGVIHSIAEGSVNGLTRRTTCDLYVEMRTHAPLRTSWDAVVAHGPPTCLWCVAECATRKWR